MGFERPARGAGRGVTAAQRITELEEAMGRIARATADPPVLLAQAAHTLNLVNWCAAAALSPAAGGGDGAE